MLIEKSKLVIPIAFSFVFAACSSDDNNDTKAPPEQEKASYQQELIDNGQINFDTDTGLTIDPDTFAITSTLTFPGAAQALPAGMADLAYFGAVDPATATGSAWWNGWTVHDAAIDGSLLSRSVYPLADDIESGDLVGAVDKNCPIGTLLTGTQSDTAIVTVGSTTVEFPVCVIADDILADVTLSNDFVYILDGIIKVGDGDQAGGGTTNATLTIESGSQLFGVEGTAAGIRVTRDSSIDADGNMDMPIIMAAVSFSTVDPDGDGAQLATGIGDITDFTGRGDWGGLIVDGNAKHNGANADGEVVSEAAPDGDNPLFGGSDDTDSSGTIRYVVIGESGFAFRADQEVQGLTLEAVGSGTTIAYIQIFGSEDDGIEWFGGTVNLRYVVVNGPDDDGLDFDEGYTGNIQNAIVRMGASNGDRGIESDNNGADFDATPRSAPNLSNILILGNSGKADKSTLAALHREGFGGKVFRSVYTDDLLAGTRFEAGCLDVDDAKPVTLEYFDTIFNCSPQNIAVADD